MTRQGRLAVWFVVLSCLVSTFVSLCAAQPACAIEINLPAYRLYLYCEGRLLHDYPIAIGKPGTPTPIGRFRLICKVHDPIWHPPDGSKPVPPGPMNPLGRWWLGLSVKGYGIHGCWDESSIGKAVSNGCIRLHNRDVAELVKYMGVGTAVSIVYKPFALAEDYDGGEMRLWIGRDVYHRYSALVKAAMDFLRQALSSSWEAEATRSFLPADPPAGWYEVAREVKVYRRETPIDVRAYYRGGQVWFARGDMARLPSGGSVAAGEGDVSLEELATATLAMVDWRYLPDRRAVVAYPVRLRSGEAILEGAVRLVRGRVMVDVKTLTEFIAGCQVKAIAEGAPEEGCGEWVLLAEVPLAGWMARWCPETWEVVAGGTEDTSATPGRLSPEPPFRNEPR